jgi:hypothetical protein
MRTVSYEASVQRNYIELSRKIGSLKGDLFIVRATLKAHLPNIDDDGLWAALTDCVERIDAALAEKEI